MLETPQGDLGCNRRVGGLCSCVSYQLVHLEVRYVKLNLAIFHRISSACNSASVEAIFYPQMKFGLSSIHLQSMKWQLQLLS